MDLRHGMYHPEAHIEIDTDEMPAPSLEDDAMHRVEMAKRNAALEVIDIEVKQHYATIRKLEIERAELQSLQKVTT